MKYHLKLWGGDLEKLLTLINLKYEDYFFSSRVNRDNFKNNVINLMSQNNLKNIIFAEYEGDDVDKERVAIVTLELPNGKVHRYEESFGYGYPVDSIYFMYEDGNYSCDCNKSIQLINNNVDISEFECGDEIKLVDLKIELRGESIHKKTDVEIEAGHRID